MLDQLTGTLTTDTTLMIGGAVLALLLLVLLARTVPKLVKAQGLADKLTGPVMFLGMLWSADAVWEITGPGGIDLPVGLRIAMCAVLEFMLLVAMLRTKDCMRENKHPGRSGKTAWMIACLMAGVGVIAGLMDGNVGVALFRPIIPLVLTRLWWIGVIGEGDPEETSSWNWTPRNLLIRIGALKPGRQDVKKVQRDHLLQRMTDLYYQIQHTKGDKQKKHQARLAKLTLDADDAMVREVMARVSRTTWVETQPLPYRLTQAGAPSDAGGDASSDAGDDAPGDAADAARVTQMKLPPPRRVKDSKPAATSGDALDADPATQAAHLVLTQNLSLREAARAVGGASDATIRRRIKTITENADDAVTQSLDDAPVTHPQTNGHPVLAEAGMTSEEN